MNVGSSLLLLLCSAPAATITITGPVGAGVFAYDTDAADYFARIVTNSGTISTGTKTAINTFVLAAKAHSYWADLYYVLPFAGDQLAAALTPLKYGAGNNPATNVGPFVGGDYAEASGLIGDGSTKHLNTGVNPSTMLTAYSTHLCVIIFDTAASVGSSGCRSGGYPAAMVLLPKYTGGNCLSQQYNYFSNSGTATISSLPTPIGMILGTKTNTTTHVVYQNGVAGVTSTGADTQTTPNNVMYVMATRNESNGAENFETRRVSWFSVGAAFDATKALAYHNDTHALMVALGRCAP